MLSALEFLIAGVLVVSLLVMSILDFALENVNQITMRRLAEAPRLKSKPLWDAMVNVREEVLMAVHICIQTLLIAIAVLLTGALLRTTLHEVIALSIGALTTFILVVVFRQLLPRVVAIGNPDWVLSRLVPALTVPYYLLRPLVRMIMSVLNRFHRWDDVTELEDEDEASEEEIQAFIDAGQQEGILEQDEGELIQSIVHFGDKLALEVMTPRPQIVAADVSWSVERTVNLIVSKRHSRIPVYRNELDSIEGILHERDLLRVWKSGSELDNLRSVLHPVHFVPETKPIDDLLQEMRAEGHQIVLVVDEYGGISGLITTEDLVEEIVGETHDTDSESERLLEEGEGSYLLPGSLDLDIIESRFGVPLVEDTECTTVGGVVVELFGRLPTIGDKLLHQGFFIEVIDADRRRIRRIRIRLMRATGSSK